MRLHSPAGVEKRPSDWRSLFLSSSRWSPEIVALKVASPRRMETQCPSAVTLAGSAPQRANT